MLATLDGAWTLYELDIGLRLDVGRGLERWKGLGTLNEALLFFCLFLEIYGVNKYFPKSTKASSKLRTNS